MSSANPDADTHVALREAEALEAMFETPGWAVAERELNVLIDTLKDVTRLDVEEGDITQQVRDRINLVAAMQSWLDDLRGRVNNARYTKTPETTSNLVTRR